MTYRREPLRALVALLGAALVIQVAPASASGTGSTVLEVSGELVLTVVDRPDEESAEHLEILASVDVDGTVIEVPDAIGDVVGRTGDPVTVSLLAPRGTSAAQAVAGAAEESGVRVVEVATDPVLAGAVDEVQAAAIGAHTLTLVPVYWTAPDGATQSSLSSLAGAAAQYWSEQSDGRIAVTTTTLGWTQIPAPTGCDYNAIMSSALAATGLSSPTSTRHVAVYFPSYPSCGWAGLAAIGGGTVWINGYQYTDVLAHEFGHNLGLGHANAATCTVSGVRVPLAPSLSACSLAEYGDRADVMGIAMPKVTGSLNTALAEPLGLVTVDVVGAGEVAQDSLFPLAAVTSLRALAVPSPAGTVFVDYRPAVGRDTRVTSWAGVQVHLQVIDPIHGYPTSYLLDMSPSTVVAFSSPALAQGVSWTVPGTTQTVRVLGIGATAQVSAGPAGLSDPVIVSYVTRVYSDLLGRAPDAAGLEAWTSLLATGTPRVTVANSITASGEYRSALIRAAYQEFLGRAPDAAGLASWLRAMGQGVTIQQMEAGFLGSQEYYQAAGGTDTAWVRQLYLDVLGRGAGDAEVAAWLRVLPGAGRTAVALGFFLSAERLGTEIDAQYQHLLGRGIDAVGRQGWVSAIQGGVRFEAVVGGIVASDEYRARVVG